MNFIDLEIDCGKLENISIENDKISMNIHYSKPNCLIYLENKKLIKITIQQANYVFDLLGKYVLLESVIDNKINIVIERLYGNEIKIVKDVISCIKIFEFGNPLELSNNLYQVMYSFDRNYFSGAFSSIYSLLENFDQHKLHNLTLNLCIPKKDLVYFLNKYPILLKNHKKQIDTIIYLLDGSVINDSILKTKCYKGGNHLLKLSNFNRLICGHIIQCKDLLYLDSDTIVQTDMSKCLDNIPKEDDYIIMGKRSELKLRNILNVNNFSHARIFVGDENDEKHLIFTGTLIINPNKFKKYFEKMLKIVEVHNSLENRGGLYKLFTMSLINISLISEIKYLDDFLINLTDLGFRKEIESKTIEATDVLDWSGLYKPWFINGLYKKYWAKYDVIKEKEIYITTSKNTIESFQ